MGIERTPPDVFAALGTPFCRRGQAPVDKVDGRGQRVHRRRIAGGGDLDHRRRRLRAVLDRRRHDESLPIARSPRQKFAALFVPTVGRPQPRPVLEASVEKVANLPRAIWEDAPDEQKAVIGRKLGHLGGRQERAGIFLLALGAARQPDAGARVALLNLPLRGLPEQIRDALGGLVVVGGVRQAHVAIVENRVVRTVSLFELVERLRNEKRLDAVVGQKREGGFEELELPEQRKLVE